MVNFGDKEILSDKYLFSKNFKRLPIASDEIYWLYTTTYNRYSSIKLGTKNNGIISYSGVEVENRRYKTKLFQNYQKRTDTKLLLDYSIENKEKYKKLLINNIIFIFVYYILKKNYTKIIKFVKIMVKLIIER